MKTSHGLHRIAEIQGKLLVNWLNQCAPGGETDDAVPSLLALLLRVEAGKKAGRPAAEEAWSWFLNKLASSKGQGAALPPGEGQVRLKASEHGFNFEVLAGFKRGKLHVEVVCTEEKGKALLAFKTLTDLGQADRVRLCPNCRRWFFARRADSKLCSAPCQITSWRKTEKGRKARADYMRRFRGEQRERERKQNLTEGRLKATKSILAKLGK